VKRLSKLGSSKLWSDPGYVDWPSCERGVSRLRRALLSFASPKESKQRKGDPGRRPATRGSLRYSVGAGSAELGPAGLRQSSPFIRPTLRCSASHKGPERRHGTTSGSLFQTLFRVSSLGVRRFSPSRRQRRATEGFAEIARGLSEARRAEFRSAREDRVAQGTGEAGADAGSPSFCLLFLGEARKSKARLKREKQHFKYTTTP